MAVPGCTSDGGDRTAPAGPATLDAHGSLEQISVHAEPRAELALFDRNGNQVAFDAVDGDGRLQRREAARADAKGSLVMRGVDPGKGYVVTRLDGDAVQSEPITVTGGDERPDADAYEDQRIGDGFGYVTTRDGTELAVKVTLPGPVDEGPYPTVVEYSADAARPGKASIGTPLGIAAALGYATVGVNLRGTGCSGGAFSQWEEVQSLDGYDVVQVLAAQRWVAHGRVGLVGVGDAADAIYGVAALRPTGLAAIAPIGAFDDAYRSVLRPSGIPNETAMDRLRATEDAAAAGGTAWVQDRIDGGDRTCARNQALRGQNVRLSSELADLEFHPDGEDAYGASFAPAVLAQGIAVPTFLVASWQDERAGGHAATLVPSLDQVERAFVTLMNGNERQALAVPTVLQRWYEFLEFYVAQEVPETSTLSGLYPGIAAEILREEQPVAGAPFPAQRYPVTLTYENALDQFQQDPRVRVLFGIGGAPGIDPGLPVEGWDEPFGLFPPPEVAPTTWYLSPDATLQTDAPTVADDASGSSDEYRSDPEARPATNLPEDASVDVRLPPYDWEQAPSESSVSYTSPLLLVPVVMVGSASADLWIRSSDDDADLQVTLSEVRPDGQEVLIQSGWLRASQRGLDQRRSTVLQPHPTQLEADAEPLVPDEFTPVRVEVAPFAHAFRLGSRIRVTISAPGGDTPRWRFDSLPGERDVAVARSVGRPSALVVPVVPGAGAPTPLPSCPGLRSQPCRPFGPPVS
ncbi:MAG: CocE/NonD family hydrolase [Acidimicrobiales bacterium]